MESTVTFLRRILLAIGKQDKLHAKTLRGGIEHSRDFWELMEIVQRYFTNRGVKVKQIVADYMHMVNDMRREGVYFQTNGRYACQSSKEAYEKVYSNKEVMSYYMNALVVSQVLWRHHFTMFQYFKETLPTLDKRYIDVLDIGAGHGLFSYFTRKLVPVNSLDIIDLSEESLDMTKSILGNNNVRTIWADINGYYSDTKYDLIIMGEVLEHLDSPLETLVHVRGLMKDDGVLWITVPTNAPAIDHIYLFKSKEEIVNMLKEAGLGVMGHCDCQADGLTRLIGLFCKEI